MGTGTDVAPLGAATDAMKSLYSPGDSKMALIAIKCICSTQWHFLAFPSFSSFTVPFNVICSSSHLYVMFSNLLDPFDHCKLCSLVAFSSKAE